MVSDILVLFSAPQSEIDMSRAISRLMEVDTSVLAHRKEGSERLLLVKFSPRTASPNAILQALRSAGFTVSIAGG